MSQILTQIEDVLKTDYMPALANQLNITPSPFLEMINHEKLTRHKATVAAPIGMNGGFGFGTEGAGTPAAGAQKYESFEIASVDMYVDIQISDKTIKLGSDDKGAMINALDGEVEGAHKAGKWNIGRALFGDGSGVLAKITSVASNIITLDSVSKVREGLTIDVFADGATTPTTKALRIEGIDRVNKKVILSGTPGVETGFITVQNSYNRELCGLGAIFNDEIDELYGLKKSENLWMKPLVMDAKHDLTDGVLYDAVSEADETKDSKINLVMMGKNAFTAYRNYMRDSNVVVVDKMLFKGGAVGYKVVVGDREAVVVNERFLPEDEAWCVDTKAFTLKDTGWDFAAHTGSIFQLIPGTSIYRALLANYGNLICGNPGGCVRITNCNIA